MPADIDAFKDAMRALLEERSRVPEAEHREHHDWVRERIAKEQARTAFWQALAQKSLPGIVWALVVAAATGLWHLIKNHLTWS